jgi:hypothetical protein
MTECDQTSPPRRTGLGPEHPQAPSSSRALSADLRALAEHFQDRPVRLAEVVELLRGRGHRFLIVLLCLPLLTPIPLPGISTLIGLVIALIGLRLALGEKLHLPERLMQKELPPRILPKVLRASSRLVGAFERLSKPRLQLFYRHAAFQRLGGVLIALCGLKLLLPLPIPMSNFFPCLSATLLAAGSFEEDGVVFLAGLVAFTTSLAYFALLALGGAAAIDEIWHRVTGS